MAKSFAENDRYFITDVCAILDKNGYRVANGPMYEIPKVVYDAALKDNRILERINGIKKGDTVKSIIDYISEGSYNRAYATRVAVQRALNAPYSNNVNAKLDFSSVITFDNDNTRALERKCFLESLEHFNLEQE